MARVSSRRPTNELEFQGQVLDWMNTEIARRPALKLDRVTQEKPRLQSGKRNDLVVWKDRANEIAFLAIELKTPTTAINDPTLLRDAIEKAQQWRASYFAVWNMQRFELYQTPAAGDAVLPSDAIATSDTCAALRSVEEWLQPKFQSLLQEQATSLLDAAAQHALSGGHTGLAIDAEIFVARLTAAISRLRGIIYSDLARAANASRRLRAKLRAAAAEQGFLGFVEDIDYAIAGQIGYRYIGQILFYYALRRKLPNLPLIVLAPTDRVPDALASYWNEVRRYDYEALFAPHEMETFVPINDDGQFLMRQLTAQLGEYDWASLTDDVLGSIFEHLIPQAEQMLLGQFYTPRPVADFLTAFAMDGENPLVLDPGCGSGTFLMSAYGYLNATQRISHRDLLPRLWGFDISPFAAELAVINLYRQDLSEYENFPRVVTGSYFDRSPGQTVQFPAPRITAGGSTKVDVPIPLFDCILANPPYVRSQHQDDLDASYRAKLFTAAAHVGIAAAAKTDLFAFFLYQSIPFLAPGARVGFVTSASWLTADFAAKLQSTLTSELRLVAVVGSERESFFTQVDVNTVLLIAEKPDPQAPPPDDAIRFITLKKPLAELASDTDYWRGVVSLVDELEGLATSIENDRYRAKLVSRGDELSALTFEPDKPRNWSKYLRAPLSYYAIFGDDHDC